MDVKKTASTAKGWLSKFEEQIGLADPEKKWYSAMSDRAVELGIKTFLANFLFDKDSLDKVTKIDYFYLLIRIYGFFTAVKLVKKGLGALINKMKFNSKMRKIEKRNLGKMYCSTSREPEWVVITGATSGIGLEHAKNMVDLGHNVLIISRSPEKLEKVKSDLETRKLLIDQKIEVVTTDFAATTPEEYYDKLDEVMSRNKIETVKLVINNVGQGPFGAYQLA